MGEIEQNTNARAYAVAGRIRSEQSDAENTYQRVEALMLELSSCDPVQVAIKPSQPIDWETLDVFNLPERDFRPLLKLINNPGVGLHSQDSRIQNGALCLMAAVTRQAHNLIVTARHIDDEVLAAVAALHMMRQMLKEADWRNDSPLAGKVVRFQHLLANMADRAYTRCRKMKPRPVESGTEN